MKKVFFAGLLVFSLLINVSVGIVIAKHWWLKHDSRDKDMLSSCPALSSQDVKSISGDWYDARQSIMATRKELHTKRAEVLDLVAANPGDLKPAEGAIQDMVNLRAGLELQILQRVSKTMASLTPEKREAFLDFLKRRTCRMKGAGKGMGTMGGADCCPPEGGVRTGPGM